MGNKNSKVTCGYTCCCISCQRRKHRAHPKELENTSHKNQTTSWLPPRDNWECGTGLPYGWETGVDKHDKPYFINHVEKYTTREDPRNDPEYVEPPKPRDVELERDPEKGFGFVAGSEKPVVVRFVTDGGPSVDKLLAGDQILKINAEDVRKAPREKVIELVRACKQSIVLTVCQPYSDNSSRKSALLTAAKKAKLKSNPSRVRFADSVMVNGAPVLTPSAQESYVPFMPNVLKVFLENGQTKSFKYDNKTTVKDVMQSLQEKLNIKSIHHFNVVLQNMKNNTAGKMTLLQEQETLAELAARPGARHFRCLFRVAYVPRDAYDLVREDAIAFEYFYLQCCNDVIHERFVPELKYDTALRLAALHIQQHATSNNMTGKISIKAIEKECGLEKFVPRSLMENMKGKDLRKMLSQYLKMNQSLTAPGQKQLSALQAKLHYMKIVSELKTFGSRVFMVTLLDQKTEAMVLVGPKHGISVVTNIKSYTLSLLAEFEYISRVRVTKEGENMQRVDIDLNGEGTEPISLGLLTEDAQNFVCMVSGYYHIFVDRDKRIVETTQGKNTSDPDVPPYSSKHRVKGAPWTYPEDLVSEVVQSGHGENGQVCEDEKLIDLALPPPVYTENKEYLAQIKQELGMKSENQDTPDSVQLTTFQKADSVESPVDSQSHNTSIYEEAVTSFGATPANTAGSDSTDESSLNSSASSQQLRPSFQTFLTISSQNGIASSIRQNVPLTNGHAAFDSSRLDEIPSDTDSGSGADVEKRPLLPPSQGVSVMNGDMRRTSFDAESDETDSYGTPSDSPAKGKLGHNGIHSFGLMSPDLIPEGEMDHQMLVESFGLHSPDEIPVELINVLQDPTAVQGQRVYFDPDIIDLTLFPPPMTPEDDNMIDFTELAGLPPPPFAPRSHVSTSLHLTGAAQGASQRQSSRQTVTSSSSIASPKQHPPPPPVRGGQQKLAKSASVGHCPDFLDNDIDDLIARFTVPPPPSEIGAMTSDLLSQTWHGARPKVLMEQTVLDTKTIEDEFASLIIPPPPESSSPSAEEIPTVPPVSEIPAETKRKKFRHKRSSSVDISSLKLAKEFLASSKSRSVDSQKPSGSADSSVHRQLDPPSSLGQIGRDSGTGAGIAAESPATVSEKLNNLLKSLPQVEGNWTGSLRLNRSSSLDILASAGSAMSKSGYPKAASLRVLTTKRSSSVESTPLNKLFVPPPKEVKPIIPKAQSVDNVHTPEKPKEEKKSDSSESFASLKAKLKACKDDLVQRTNRSSFRLKKNKSESSDSLDKTKGEEKKSSLRRSGSFSELIARFSRQGSKDDSKKTNGSVESDSEMDKGSDGSMTPTSEARKKMKMIETLALPRATILRPPGPANTIEKPDAHDSEDRSDQSKSKKSGPLKALSSVFTSEEKTDKGSTWLKGGSPAKSKSDPSKSKKYKSKDDSSMLSSKTKDKLKTNPYATVKMWRPLSMTTSSSKDEEVYQSFTNFDNFREMSQQLKETTKEDLFEKEPLKLKKTISFEDEVKPDYSDTASRDTEFSKFNGSITSEISTPVKDPPPILRRASVSEESYLVVSDSVTDSVKNVISRTYGVDDFDLASKDVEQLLSDLKTTMESLKGSRIDRSEKQFEMCKEELVSQTKHFVNDAKLLVSSATHTKDKLAIHLEKGIHTLAKIFLHSQAVMLMMFSSHLAQHLGFEVIKVSNAFKSTLNAANAAVGKPLTDPHMKYLMRQATNLASLLSTLLKTLKDLRSK